MVSGRADETLTRLLNGDPLRLGEHCRARLREDGYFLPLERLTLRATARATLAELERGDVAATKHTIEACVDQAIADLIEEQFCEELQAIPSMRSQDARFYTWLANATGMDPDSARIACLILNDLSTDCRLCFRAVLIDGLSIAEYAARTNLPVERMNTCMRAALHAIHRALVERAARHGQPPRHI